ncbi:MAG: hypothetical protein ACD_41C00137G0003 [uncultured bacterium]|nr:MAG: hypothetical protein ACD_41C00137G0003 [uncultured bacterium]
MGEQTFTLTQFAVFLDGLNQTNSDGIINFNSALTDTKTKLSDKRKELFFRHFQFTDDLGNIHRGYSVSD